MGIALVRAVRRLAIVGALSAVMVVALGASPASAQGYQELTVTGSFTGVGQLRTDNCMLFHQIVDGGGNWTELGTSTFHLDFCLNEPPDGQHYPITDGTFDITAAEGTGTLSGVLTGDVEAGGFPPPEVGFPLHMTLTITDGTGRFAGALGELRFEGAFGYGAADLWGTVDGTVRLPLPMPATRDDCKNGGWQDLYDDEGHPFRNQGHCIAWVNHHT